MSQTEFTGSRRYCFGTIKNGHLTSWPYVCISLLALFFSRVNVRRLTSMQSLEAFDNQARMQYVLRSPESNPFGDEDAPKGFSDLNVFTKVSATVELGLPSIR